MKTSWLIRFSVVIGAACLALTACSSGTATSPSSPETLEVLPGMFPQESDGDPVTGGTLTYADLSEIRTLDPSLVIPTGASGGSALIAIYDQLTTLNPDTGLFEPHLAKEVSSNEEFTEWTITLRPDVTFSDGTPLDADAVVGSMTWFSQQAGAWDMALIAPLWGGVEKVDDLTVRISLTEPWANFPAMLARSLGFIVAPAAVADPENFQPIGAGAFTFGDYKPGEELILTANPNYWDGAPHIEALRFVWLGADNTKMESLTGRTVHVAYVNDAKIIEEQIVEEDMPRFVSLTNLGQVILLNQTEGNPGAFLKARRAMAHAIDTQVITDRALAGHGYHGKTIFAPVSQWYDAAVEVNTYDPALATQLLDEAKAEGYDGKIVLLTNDSPVNSESALAFKALFEAVGFETEIDPVRNLADFISRLYAERDFSVVQTGLQVVDYDPVQNLWNQLAAGASSNISGISDPELDAMLIELRGTPLSDKEEAQAIISRLETYVQEEVPLIPFRYLTPTITWSEDVHGVMGTNEVMVDFSKAWISE